MFNLHWVSKMHYRWIFGTIAKQFWRSMVDTLIKLLES